MKLNEFNKSKGTNAKRALKEHFNVTVNTSRMNLSETNLMLTKVKRLMSEVKMSKKNHTSEGNASYLKLVFLEQALKDHYEGLKSGSTRLVVENEEVEKSQVVLAAQDMVDSVQKMIETVSDMLVKELPAVTDSITSQVGSNESEQFNSQAAEGLTSLQAALTQAKSALQSAVGVVTGQSAGPAAMGDMSAPDMSADAAMGAPDMGAEDDMNSGNVGREFR
jgi:hypothetical protein